jgi:hypothetical protein
MSTKLNKILSVVKRQAKMKSTERRHVHIGGLPGWGKTRGLESLSPLHVTIPCPLLSREDICIPVNEDSKMSLLIHPMIQDFLDQAEASPKAPAVMIFDEIMQSSIEDQKAYASIIYDRVIAGTKLPANVLTVSTGNLRKHQSGAGSTLAHLVGRMKIYEIEPSPEDWMEWGATRLHHDVLAYVAMKPQASYCDQDSAGDAEMGNMYREAARQYSPYPSARSWTALSDELKTDESCDTEDFASHVGQARAVEFNALRGIKLPSHADLLAGRADFPKEVMAQWVAVIRCGQSLTVGNSANTIKVIRALNPEMVEVFLRVAGQTAKVYMKSQGKTVSSPTNALLQFPDFRETLFSDDSRYAQALEASI